MVPDIHSTHRLLWFIVRSIIHNLSFLIRIKSVYSCWIFTWLCNGNVKYEAVSIETGGEIASIFHHTDSNFSNYIPPSQPKNTQAEH